MEKRRVNAHYTVVYKKLRNRVNSELKKDNICFNNERVKNAADDNEIWNVVKDVTKQKSSMTIILEEDGKKIEDEEQVANIFNDFFVEKIQNLQDNIDKKTSGRSFCKTGSKNETKKSEILLKKSY